MCGLGLDEESYHRADSRTHGERQADDGRVWRWLDEAPASPSARPANNLTYASVDDDYRTSLASLRLEAGALVGTANSRERAERLEQRIGDLLADRLPEIAADRG